ncbi:MAG: EAL domain-containing protein [Pseudomonadota bacterium]|nr:EAL domain-containing protein [Pseudomonadota bacterium]
MDDKNVLGDTTLLVVMLAVAAALLAWRMLARIQQQKRALLSIQKRLTQAQQIAHLGSWDWNIATDEWWWSEQTYHFFGFARQQFDGSRAAILCAIDPDDRAHVEECLQLALENPDSCYAVQYRVVRPDGTVRMVVERIEVTCNVARQPTHMMGVVQDVTERKRVEQQLLLFDHVFKQSSEGIVLTNANREIVEINESFSRITGYSREEVLGQNPCLIKLEEHNRDCYAQMWQQVEQQGDWSGEMWDQHKNGTLYSKALSITMVKNGQGRVSHYIGIFSDISHNKQIEQQLQKMAFYDELTGLPNRTLCKDRLNQEIKVAHRREEQLAVLFLDLDHFKYVNDTLGHSCGDLLLLEAARRIQRCVRESDTVARLGGDEFMVLLTGVASIEMVERIAVAIIQALAEKFILQGQEVTIGVSIGISLYPDNGGTYDELTKNADVAMYRAKEAGRNTFMFFTRELQEIMVARLNLERDLRRAIQREEFELYYQPKVDLRSGQIVGMEALLRWPHEDGHMVMPSDFIPLAEETGLILPLGEWVLRQACRQAVVWRQAGHLTLRMAVNLSAKQFDQADIATLIESVLDETGLPPEALELEVTESMVMKDADQAVVTLRRLRALGVHIAVDDFGTGYSSLSYLKKLPLQTLKIDRSFVRDLGHDSDDEAIVSAIISMAGTMEMRVVAEGVETVEQLEFLRRDGCDEAQGFLFSRPVPADQFELLLQKGGYPFLRRVGNSLNQRPSLRV